MTPQHRPKYQVFVSSTFRDLRAERDAVVWELLKERQIPVGMESFPATDDRGWQIIQRTIDDSDYYVLLVAGRYGSVDPATGKSWTEMEYDYARSKGIPVLAFVRDKSSITGDKMDTGENATKLEAFGEKISSAHHIRTWKTADDLRSEVASALRRAIMDAEDAGTPRVGWIRGDAVPPDTLSELTRLSRENGELRARLAILGEGNKPVLAFALNKAEEPTALEVTLPQYESATKRSVTINYVALAERSSRTVWLFVDVTNTGTAVARNIRARFTVPKLVDELDIGRAEREAAPFGLAVPSRRPWYLDPNREIYVSREHCKDGTAAVEQRIKSIGINQKERLIPIGLVLDADTVRASPELDFAYEIASEEGARCKGTVTLKIIRGDPEVVSENELDNF